MLPEVSIEEMKTLFTEIILEIFETNKNKHTRREMNLGLILALPAN